MDDHGSWQELERLLRKPLEYASRLPPKRLVQVMPDLGQSLSVILDRHPRFLPLLAEFKSQLQGLDQLVGPERMARIIALIRILDRLDKSKPSPAAPSFRPEPPALTPEEKIFFDRLKELETPVQWVKGVGPRIAEKLERLGIKTVDDLIYHLPARYEDRRGLKKIVELRPGERATVIAEIMVAGQARVGKRHGYQILLYDGTGTLTAKWFHYRGDYLEKKYQKGRRVILSGMIHTYGRNLEVHHPEMEIIEEEGEEELSELAGIIPVYPSTEGMFQKTLRNITRQALAAYADKVPESIPKDLLEKHELPGIGEALALVHAPPEDDDLGLYNEHRSTAHGRLAYEEFFFLELGLALRRQGMIEEPAAPVEAQGELAERLKSALPFTLTRSQDKVIAEILADLARPFTMHRLLQGDVGSGKTVVAVLAALATIECGFQAALMAPTEVLAEQHYRTIKPMMESVGLETVLLTGSIRGKPREQALARIAAGEVPLVLGTHAVIQDKVQFKNLALGVIDEQHRFGVLQRAKLKAKGPEGATPHLLVMTATPIPRTLAMTVYGDLAVSVIREMPPGRQPITTKVFREREVKAVWDLIRSEASQGRQAFIVYPLVEESENFDLRDATSMFEKLRDRVFPKLKVELLHGRMSSEDKDRIMRSFLANEIQVLVSTTVIEVGIDAPNATVMVVEHADRFGLSQLHQLRGRIGRGEYSSHCCLITGFTRSEDAWRRLKVMERTRDGFKIAEEDLAIRGPGEFFGTRQSGLPDFRVANIIRDAELLSRAREDAFEMVKMDPSLQKPENRLLLAVLKRRWGKRLRLGSVG